MVAPRAVEGELAGMDTLEGAGVRLHRVFGNREVPRLDPFLLLDHFRSSNPADYVAGFPWHPHRGIETVTYMLDGRVEHGDSLGNEGAIESGDVQWMTSGSGILHQEMPKRKEGLLEGFQLWVNLPAKEKMSTPAYRGLHAPEIPTVQEEDGSKVKIVAGSYHGVEGPVTAIPVDPTYLDVQLAPRAEIRLPVPKGHTAFAYTLDGEAYYDPLSQRPGPQWQAAILGEGEEAQIRSGPRGSRFLFVSGRPLHEPVAWYGPIVMNTHEELETAILDLRHGRFIRDRGEIREE